MSPYDCGIDPPGSISDVVSVYLIFSSNNNITSYEILYICLMELQLANSKFSENSDLLFIQSKKF